MHSVSSIPASYVQRVPYSPASKLISFNCDNVPLIAWQSTRALPAPMIDVEASRISAVMLSNVCRRIITSSCGCSLSASAEISHIYLSALASERTNFPEYGANCAASSSVGMQDWSIIKWRLVSFIAGSQVMINLTNAEIGSLIPAKTAVTCRLLSATRILTGLPSAFGAATGLAAGGLAGAGCTAGGGGAAATGLAAGGLAGGAAGGGATADGGVAGGGATADGGVAGGAG